MYQAFPSVPHPLKSRGHSGNGKMIVDTSLGLEHNFCSSHMWVPISETQNVLVLHFVPVLGLSWLFSKAHRWELAAVGEATMSRTGAYAIAHSIPPPPGSIRGCHPCPKRRFQMKSRACLPYRACRRCHQHSPGRQ